MIERSSLDSVGDGGSGVPLLADESAGLAERSLFRVNTELRDAALFERVCSVGVPTLLATVGSNAELQAGPESDLDTRGIYTATLDRVAGLEVLEPAMRSDGVDETWWELGHAVRRAVEGADTVVQVLFSPNQLLDSPVGHALLDRRQDFVTTAVLGTMTRQAAAMHRARDASDKQRGLAMQLYLRAETVATSGEYVIPLSAEQRDTVSQLRYGLVSHGEALTLLDEADERAVRAVENSDLPAVFDLRRASDLVVSLRRLASEVAS